MNGPAGTVRYVTEHGAVGHIGPDHAPLEVWTGSAWVPVPELLDNHERFIAIQHLFRFAGRLR